MECCLQTVQQLLTQYEVAFSGVLEWIQQLSKTRAGQRLLAAAGANSNGYDDDKSGEIGGAPSESS